MSCQPSNQAELLARKAKIEAALAAAWTSYTSLISNTNESYSFDDGSGKQSAKRRKLDELEKSIERLQGMLDNVNDLLNCQGGVVSLSFGRLG